LRAPDRSRGIYPRGSRPRQPGASGAGIRRRQGVGGPVPERERRGWGPCALPLSANHSGDWLKCSELRRLSANHGGKTVRNRWLPPIPRTCIYPQIGWADAMQELLPTTHSRSNRWWPICVAATLALLGTWTDGGLRADDWPQWLGPQRDANWRETGILKAFPPGGPRRVWRTAIGSGYTGPAVVGNRVYLMDRQVATKKGKKGSVLDIDI